MQITFDFTKTDKKIKPMNAIGQPPICGMSDAYFHYLTEAHIPYSRLHDVGGWFGGNMYVDIPNLFRDFDADVDDPASYDFAFTDILMKHLMEAGCMPYFRLGVTIENFEEIRSYRLEPPADFLKWAKICEHVIRHYNEGWANGYHYNIVYWEIWNEPEGHNMWHGTMKQYFALYETTARHLKACFGDTIKVGGFGSIGRYCGASMEVGYTPDPNMTREDYGEDSQHYINDFTLLFLDFIKETGTPLDFFSWHAYRTAREMRSCTELLYAQLETRGMGDIETHINEWANFPTMQGRGSSAAAAEAAAVMICQQTMKTHMLCYYDGRLSIDVYGGLFNPLTREPYGTYYSLKGFGELLVLGYEAGGTIVDADGVYALAAHDGNGKRGALIVNNSDTPVTINTNLPDMKVQLIDDAHMMSDTDYDSASFTLETKQTVYIQDK